MFSEYQRMECCDVCFDTDIFGILIEDARVCKRCVKKYYPEYDEDQTLPASA